MKKDRSPIRNPALGLPAQALPRGLCTASGGVGPRSVLMRRCPCSVPHDLAPPGPLQSIRVWPASFDLAKGENDNSR